MTKKVKMLKFRAQHGDGLIEHLRMQEKENINLDKDDNLRWVFLTAKEIFYLIECIRKAEGIIRVDEQLKGGKSHRRI